MSIFTTAMGILTLLITAVLLIWIIATLIGTRRSMPPGLSMASPLLSARHLTFLSDLTYLKGGELICEQHILTAVLKLIKEAESFIILDIFLYNDLQKGNPPLPPLSRKVTQALLAAKKKRPALNIWVISDPANTGYGSYPNPYFQELQAAGATVVLCNLDRLPDSNILYAGFWNLIGRPFARKSLSWLPSPFYPRAPRFSISGWLTLINFKANHRKIVLTDKAGLITSANYSHDASAANSNIAFCFSGPLLSELLRSEQAVTALSRINLHVELPQVTDVIKEPSPQIQVLTEGKIKKILLDDLKKCQAPATLWLAMFYLADQQILAALVAMARRGITINLILDANRDAFGHQKNGVPNRPVAAWLKKKCGDRIHIRWYDSHAEQFHSKLILLVKPEQWVIMGGSANLTRRNIDDYNLETNLRIISLPAHDVSQQVLGYFERLWHNSDGHFTADYQKFADRSLLKHGQYLIQERSGFSLF